MLYYFRKKLQALEILCIVVKEDSVFYSSLKGLSASAEEC